MLKKTVRDILIVFGLGVLVISTSRSAMQYISEKRDSEKWWGTYPCLHGDLVSLCYLDFVKKFSSPKINTPVKKPDCKAANTALYLHGDSYIYHLQDTAFACLSAYYPVDRNHGLKYHLDSSRKNILLIEVSERYVRSYFGGLQIFDELKDTAVKPGKTAALYAPVPRCCQASILPQLSVDNFFNKYINQNLQCNLFNYNFIIPVFECKAALNYYIFNRASGDAMISEDRNFLFLKETVSKTDIGSSYVPVNNSDITGIVNNFNKIYAHYKEEGFSEVYLSIIPNSATIVQPEGYNNLIPLIQNDVRLKMKVIDIYSVFKKSSDLYFLPGDTHWNFKGKQLWLDVVNEQLMKQ